MDELEDSEEGLREVSRGEEEEGRSGSRTSSGEQQQPGRGSSGEDPGSRTVSPLAKLKVHNSSPLLLLVF